MAKGIMSIKRGIAVLMSACMVFGMTPIQAGAEEAGTSVSGNETQTQEEPSESGSDAQTEESASGNESSGVYELNENNGAYYDEQHVRYTLSTDGSNTATVAGYDTSYVNDTNFPADKGWKITIPAKVSFGGTEYVVMKIGKDAFSSCTQLLKVDFSTDSKVNEIEDRAFWESSLKEITLPESLTSIGDYVFLNNSLSELYIPKNVSFIGTAICAKNKLLSSIKVDPENKVYNVGFGDVNCIVKDNILI